MYCEQEQDTRPEWALPLALKTNALLGIFFLLFFPDKIKLGISCELSAQQTIHMKFQALFSLKKVRIRVFFVFFFSDKIKHGISCELSAQQTIHMKFQALFSLKKLEFSMLHLCLAL